MSNETNERSEQVERAAEVLQEVFAEAPDVRRVFRLMAVAEEMLAERGLGRCSLWDKARGQDVSLFWIVRPSPLIGSSEPLYRAHVAELCDRYGAGADVRPPTRAEVIRGIMEVSKVAPLNREGMVALLHAVRGTTFEQFFTAVSAHEKHPGEAQEAFEELSRRLAPMFDRFEAP